jgi:hypothetical protein
LHIGRSVAAVGSAAARVREHTTQPMSMMNSRRFTRSPRQRAAGRQRLHAQRQPVQLVAVTGVRDLPVVQPAKFELVMSRNPMSIAYLISTRKQ